MTTRAVLLRFTTLYSRHAGINGFSVSQDNAPLSSELFTTRFFLVDFKRQPISTDPADYDICPLMSKLLVPSLAAPILDRSASSDCALLRFKSKPDNSMDSVDYASCIFFKKKITAASPCLERPFGPLECLLASIRIPRQLTSAMSVRTASLSYNSSSQLVHLGWDLEYGIENHNRRSCRPANSTSCKTSLSI